MDSLCQQAAGFLQIGHDAFSSLIGYTHYSMTVKREKQPCGRTCRAVLHGISIFWREAFPLLPG
jgi:hypothetical protein